MKAIKFPVYNGREQYKHRGAIGDVFLVPLLLTLLTFNIFHIIFYCFYCWLWTSNCHLGIVVVTVINFEHLIAYWDRLINWIDNRLTYWIYMIILSVAYIIFIIVSFLFIQFINPVFLAYFRPILHCYTPWKINVFKGYRNGKFG